MKLLRQQRMVVALALAAGSAIFLRWGLHPAARLFYEAYHLSGWDWLYAVYGPLKGAADYTSWWPGYWKVYSALPSGILVLGLVLHRWKHVSRRIRE